MEADFGVGVGVGVGVSPPAGEGVGVGDGTGVEVGADLQELLAQPNSQVFLSQPDPLSIVGFLPRCW